MPAVVDIRAEVHTTGKTGAEMEALTIYDMCKAADKGMRVTEIRLLSKSGDWAAEEVCAQMLLV